MPGQEIPPDVIVENIVDRDAERELFTGLLQFADLSRLLAIKDKEGTGKTTLLQRLHYECMFTWVTPATLISLEDETLREPFDLVNAIAADLPELEFTEFRRLNVARTDEDFSVFANLSGIIDLREATVSGKRNTFIGTKYEIQVESPSAPVSINRDKAGWSGARDQLAREECVKAFLADLKAIADEQPVVILLDSYERCHPEVKKFIIKFLIKPSLNIGQRPDRLTIVLAGRELPPLRTMLGTRHDELVRSTESLGMWEEDHVRAFLHLHGYGSLSDEDVDTVWGKIKSGWPIRRALRLADVLSS